MVEFIFQFTDEEKMIEEINNFILEQKFEVYNISENIYFNKKKHRVFRVFLNGESNSENIFKLERKRVILNYTDVNPFNEKYLSMIILPYFDYCEQKSRPIKHKRHIIVYKKNGSFN